MTLVAPTPLAPQGTHDTPKRPRDPAVDLVRAACLVAVVTVHALMVGVSITPTGVVLENALERWHLFTPFSWFAQMMPLFFVLGGFASATHLRGLRTRGMRANEYVALRLRRLLPVPFAAAVAVVTVLTALTIAGLDPAVVAEAGWRISQPLWFLGVYILCSACVPFALRAHERAPRAALAALFGGIALVDTVRWVTGVDAVGFANLLLVWLLVQQLGFWLADGRAPSLRGAVCAAAGIAALMLCGVSPANLFEALNPPTAALALLGVVQLAGFAHLRPRLRAWAQLPLLRRCSAAVNGHAMTIYSWHMPVVVLLAGAVLAGASLLDGDRSRGAGEVHTPHITELLLPTPLSTEWWLGRPLWLCAAGLAVVAVVALAGRWERGPAVAHSGQFRSGRVAAAVLVSAGGVLVILAATGAVWAWALGAVMLAVAPRIARPAATHSTRRIGLQARTR